jgi:hypothetical protein
MTTFQGDSHGAPTREIYHLQSSLDASSFSNKSQPSNGADPIVSWSCELASVQKVHGDLPAFIQNTLLISQAQHSKNLNPAPPE